MKKSAKIIFLCTVVFILLGVVQTSQASFWGVSWHTSPFGWSSSMTISSGSSWLYRPFWTTRTYVPYFLYTPAYYTMVLPSPSEYQQKKDFNRCLELLQAKEMIFNAQKELAKKQEEEKEKLDTKDIQIDIDSTPIEETPAIEPAPNVAPIHKDDSDSPTPKETIILAEGSVVMRTY